MEFIAPLPFQEALDKLDDKSLIGSLLSSSEWADVPVALRDRAFFSSRVESVQQLQQMRDLIRDFLAGNRLSLGRTSAPDVNETAPVEQSMLKVGSRAAFVNQMQQYLAASGIDRTTGDLHDLTSQTRLALVFDTQTRQSRDFGFWKQGMNPDVLDAFPASRFIRVLDVKEPRQSHLQYQDQVYLKTDPIWAGVINHDFGVPWGPWGWGCGHDVDDVDRKWCETHGLLHPGQRVAPSTFGLNHQLGASIKRIDADLIDKLRQAFGGQIEIQGDMMRWKSRSNLPASPLPPAGSPAATPAPSPRPTLAGILQQVGLSDRAKATAEQMASLREALREENPASQSAAIHHITGTDAAGPLSTASLRQMTQDFLNFFPPELVATLPRLKISVGNLEANGEYRGDGQVFLDYEKLIKNPQQLRKTFYHELMHWIHVEGPAAYRQLIREHFAARTAGETIARLPGYGSNAFGLKDDWYDAYAGRIYRGHKYGDEGIEVPTRYIEWLALPPQKMAALWNNAKFRETMKIVLQALF